jgi:hypothetical protein
MLTSEGGDDHSKKRQCVYMYYVCISIMNACTCIHRYHVIIILKYFCR